MRLDTQVQIGGQELRLIDHDVVLKLSDAGQATFRVISANQPKGVVLFDAGYTVGNLHRIFVGYVDRATHQSQKHWTVYCKELCAALALKAPISLRHCTLPDVLSEITKATDLQFITQAGSHQVSRFANAADGFYALRNTARVFSIDDFAWYQQKDGKLWLGEWKDCAYAKAGNIELDSQLYTKQQPSGATLPAIPALRPGMLLNQQRLTYVRLKSHETTIRWKH